MQTAGQQPPESRAATMSRHHNPFEESLADYFTSGRPATHNPLFGHPDDLPTIPGNTRGAAEAPPTTEPAPPRVPSPPHGFVGEDLEDWEQFKALANRIKAADEQAKKDVVEGQERNAKKKAENDGDTCKPQ